MTLTDPPKNVIWTTITNRHCEFCKRSVLHNLGRAGDLKVCECIKCFHTSYHDASGNLVALTAPA